MKTSFKVKNLIYSIILIPFLFTAVPIQNSLEKTSNSDSSTGAEVLKKEKPTIPKEYYDYSIEQIATGNDHAGAVINDGTGPYGDHLYMWGNNEHGQLGLEDPKGDLDFSFTPIKVEFFEDKGDIQQISFGDGTSAAVVRQEDENFDHLYSWGDNNYLQLGLGSMSGAKYNSEPKEVGGLPIGASLSSISMGYQSGAIIASTETGGDELYTWGNNHDYQLGYIDQGNDGYVCGPTKVKFVDFDKETNLTIEQVSMGQNHSGAIINDGLDDYLYTWGANVQGQLGFGSNSDIDQDIPKEVSFFEDKGDIEQISMGNKHSAAIVKQPVIEEGITVERDILYTWGQNDKGQLGLGKEVVGPSSVNTPEKVDFPNKGNVEQISLGKSKSTTAIVNEDTSGKDYLYTWGDNNKGQLGLGNFSSTPEPTLVADIKEDEIKQISLGTNFSITITSDGKIDYLYVWGENVKGQLGLGNDFGNDFIETPTLQNSFYVYESPGLPFVQHWYFYFMISIIAIIVIGLLIGLLIYLKKRNAVI